MRHDGDDMLRGVDSVDSGRQLLVDLVKLVATAADPKESSLAFLEAAASALGAESGFVALAAPGSTPARLEIAAIVGPHAPLLGEPSRTGADESTAVSIVFRSGEAQFVESVYDSGDDPVDGTARWRGLISAQATAVVPLATPGRSFGVMMLEWSQPQRFDDAARELTLAVASLAALAVERAWPSDEALPALTVGPPAVVPRAPRSPETGPLTPGTVPVITPSVAEDGQLRFEVSAEGLMAQRKGDEAWGSGQIRVTLPPVREPGALIDVYPIASGKVLFVVASIRGASRAQMPELVEMLRHTGRVLAVRSGATSVLEAIGERMRDAGGIGMSLEAWLGVWDAASGGLSHSQSGTAGSRILMCDGRHRDGEPETLSTWLPLEGDILHAWVPGTASLRAEWR